MSRLFFRDSPGWTAPQNLCPACRAEHDRWLDTKPSTHAPRFGIAHGSGSPYDASAAGVRDNTRARYEDWRRTVNFQRDLIEKQCLQEDHIGRMATYEEVDMLADLLELEAS